ncbi:MAG: hypothetical protein H6Q14_2358 [Bacteroidetes bacterium]|nr:hypothetical protein [Bacteroidota bacterium]
MHRDISQNRFRNFRFNQLLLVVVVSVGLFLIQSLALGNGVAVASLFALVPLLLSGLYLLFRNPLWTFGLLCLVNFFIQGATRYVNIPLPIGVVFDVFLFLTFIVIVFHGYFHPNKEKKPIPPLYYLMLLWLVYCLLQLFNPESTAANWITTIRGVAVYFVAFPLIVFLLLDKTKYLKRYILFWGILILLAGLKAFVQKNIGLDSAERLWLYTYGAHTHVIYSGIRYFSFFGDAANFGCHMGLGIVVYSIVALYEKSVKLKIFYWIVVAVATYGMMVSGTRAAMAVPFAGLACFIVIIRQWKLVVAGFIVFVLALFVFNFTTIGNSNDSMRRMRTAFQFEKDASYNLRKENQQKMRAFMGDYPFGLGIGSAKHAEEGHLMDDMATDSSFVFIWVENGIVGVTLYVGLLLLVLGYGCYLVFFKLKQPYIRGVTSAFVSGYAGMLVAGYGNEVFHQFPTGPTLYICMAFIMLSPQFDKELMYERKS